MKKLLLSVSGAISFAIFLILLAVTNQMAQSQDTQQMAKRWSEKKDVAQVSCFFSADSGITVDQIEEFEHSLDASLTEASITQDSANPGARLWADAYSADGKITVSSDRASIEASAIGIGGDFFLFHPVKLLEGAYFSGNDVNSDYCVIDEDAAWQLFGSNDVAGMTVTIGGRLHIITGVVERPAGRLEEAAGLDSTLVYVSFETMDQLKQQSGYPDGAKINHYEIVMPNPVSGFAENLVRESFGREEKEVEILENTSRYSLINRFKTIADFGTRSMNGKAIIYPYWENIARGYEDLIALLTVLFLLFLLYPVLLVLVLLIKWWRHKGWTIKDLWNRGRDKGERLLEKRRERRKQKKKENAAEDADHFDEFFEKKRRRRNKHVKKTSEPSERQNER